MISSLIRPAAAPASRSPSPESIFGASAHHLFLDEERCQHGLPGAAVAYQHSPETEIVLQIVDPSADVEKKLFAHYVWNAGILLAELVGGQTRLRDEAQRRREERKAKFHDPPSSPSIGEAAEESVRLEAELWGHDWSVAGESTIELGAGTALPSIVAALAGASRVVVTDYPSPTLLATARTNILANTAPVLHPRITVEGHEWSQLETPFATASAHSFSRVLVADAIWMDKQHEPLRASVAHFLADGGQAWVTAGFHTGRERVASFLRRVADQGLVLERVWEIDVNGEMRAWAELRKGEGVLESRRWCMLAVLRRRGPNEVTPDP